MIVERDLEKALKPYIVERALPLVLSMLQSEGVRLAFSDRKGRTLGYYMAPKSNRKLSNKQSFDQLHTISLQVNLSPFFNSSKLKSTLGIIIMLLKLS
ncbi:MAG: hypothetical protein RSA02_01295 [Bacteroidales bacterium]